MSLLLKRLISIPLLVLSFAISLNKLHFFEKQTPRSVLSLSCTETLNYLHFLFFESFDGKTFERYHDKDVSKVIKNSKINFKQVMC